MPYYTYEDESTHRQITIFQHMDEPHIWFDSEGKEWKRVFEVPQTRIDSIYSMDPNSPKEFVEKTGKVKGKLKDIYQLSAELSEKRKSKYGQDKIKENSMNRYERSRVKGTVHPERRKDQLRELARKNKHFEIEP